MGIGRSWGNAECGPAFRCRPLLDRAGIKPSAREIILEVADRGRIDDPKVGRRIELRAQHSIGKKPATFCFRPANERCRSSGGERISGARNRARLVRGGVDQMAPAHHSHRPTVQRLLSNARLFILDKARGQCRVGSPFENANRKRRSRGQPKAKRFRRIQVCAFTARLCPVMADYKSRVQQRCRIDLE